MSIGPGFRNLQTSIRDSEERKQSSKAFGKVRTHWGRETFLGLYVVT